MGVAFICNCNVMQESMLLLLRYTETGTQSLSFKFPEKFDHILSAENMKMSQHQHHLLYISFYIISCFVIIYSQNYFNRFYK